MKKIWVLFLFLAVFFGGCSQKEVNAGASDMTNDVSEFGEKVFKVRE